MTWRSTRQPARSRFSPTAMVFLALAGLALLFYGSVRYIEVSVAFHPSRIMGLTPRDAGLDFEDVVFSADDGTRLHGWFIPCRGARRTLLYFHGNAGNIADRIGKIGLFHSLGLNVFIFDYRGYGRSEGRPSEDGFYRDGRAAFDYLLSRKDAGNLPVIFYGASIGGVVAIDTALHRKPSALITEATFTSARDIARIYYPYVPSFMIGLRMDSDKKVDRIVCPKLFIHSKEDEIIPYRIGRRLYEAAAEPKEFLEVQGGHNDNIFSSESKVRAAVAGFLNHAL